jgi:hypothetical protein
MKKSMRALVWSSLLTLALAAACGSESIKRGGTAGSAGTQSGSAGTSGGTAGSSGGAGTSGAAGAAAGDTGAGAGTTGAAGDGSAVAGSGGGSAAGSGGSGSAAGTGGAPATGGAGGAAGTGTGGALGANPMRDLMQATPVGDQTLPRKLYIGNECAYDIWTFGLPGGPLKIAAGALQVVGWSNKFSGRVWPRSGCTGTGTNLKCAQTGNDTLAEFTLNAGMKDDWYDISLVDGFTIPLSILQLDGAWTPDPNYVPGGKLLTSGNCGSPVCAVDLLKNCPASQQKKDAMGNVVECVNGMSSNGGHGPTAVTTYMKMGCPTSYTYPFDDPQSLFTCPSVEQNGGVGARDYEIVYCPPQSSVMGSGFP